MKKYLFLSVVIGTMLAACSGSGSNGNSSQSSSSQLKLVAPQSYLASHSIAASAGTVANQDAAVNSGISSMPVIITNSSDVDLAGINYTYTLNDANLNQADIPNNCAIIAANSSCQLNIPISPNVVPGNIQIQASVNGADILSNVIGFSDFTPTNASGADAVLLYSDDIIFATEGPTTSFMVTAIIESAAAFESSASFNSIVLADGTGQKIPYCNQISGPVGAISSASILTYLCTIPSSLSGLELAPQLSNLSITNQQVGQYGLNSAQGSAAVETGAVQKSIRIVSPSEKLSYILQSPERINLSQHRQLQKIQVSNKGNIADTISKIELSNNNIIILNDSCSGKTIAPSDSCSYELKFDTTQNVAGNALSQLVLANTSTPAVSAISIRYIGDAPLVDVDVVATDLNFVTNARSPVETQSITLTNNSALAITPQLPNLASGKGYFSVSAPASGVYCYSGDGVLLKSNQSCSFKLSYNNVNDVDLSSFNLVMPFSYSYAGAAQIYTSVLNAHYTTRNFAQLYISDGAGKSVNLLSFKTIHNDMTESSEQVVELYNSGSIQAMGINTKIDTSANNLFSIINNTCDLTLDPGKHCQMTIKFGGTSAAANEYKSDLIISYSSGDKVLQTLLPLSGTVLMPMSANIEGVITASTFNGNGSESDPFVVEQNASPAPSVTYSFTNIGNSVGESINVILESSANGWKITQDNCSGKSLAVNASCDVILGLEDTTVIGAHNLDFANLVVSWVDQDSPAGISNEQVGTIFADVVTAPAIAINLQAVAGLQKTTESQLSYLVKQNSNYILNVSLSGGISTHKVTATVSNGTGNATLSNAECDLSLSLPTCQITIKTDSNQVGNGDFTVNLSADMPLSQTSINFHTWSGVLPATSIFNGATSFATNQGFLYTASGADIYRCSELSNGNIYSCLNVYTPNSNNPALPGTIQQLAFAGGKLYASNSPLPSVSSYTARMLDQWQVDSDGTLSNYLADLPEYTLSVGGGDTSGITSFAIYESTIYFTQFNGVGLWVCPLNSQTSTNCKLTKVSGLNFQGNAASLVVGNNLYITQTMSRLNRGLNKCLINSDGSIDSCTNISPTIPGDTQSFDGSQYSSSLSYIGGYLYGNQGGGSVTPGSDVCPFDGSKLTGNCFLADAPLSDIITMTNLDKWMYFSSVSGSGKALQSTDGKLVGVSSIIGY